MSDDTKLREWAREHRGIAKCYTDESALRLLAEAGASLVRRCAEIARQNAILEAPYEDQFEEGWEKGCAACKFREQGSCRAC